MLSEQTEFARTTSLFRQVKSSLQFSSGTSDGWFRMQYHIPLPAGLISGKRPNATSSTCTDRDILLMSACTWRWPSWSWRWPSWSGNLPVLFQMVSLIHVGVPAICWC
ncbi:hypothetical protein SEVIR_2G283601v4 [Setaria viridis]